MLVRFWGVRGSLPVPDKNVLKYGGNTTCLEIRCNDDTLIILDAGTGIRKLGKALMKTEFGKGEGEGHIFFSHAHWDHIIGIPFFEPFWPPGNKFYFYGAEYVEELLDLLFNHTYFPIKRENIKSLLNHTERIKTLTFNSEFTIGENKIKIIPLNHPGKTFGYRIESGDSVFVSAFDTEPYEHVLQAQFIKQQDLLEDESNSVTQEIIKTIRSLDDQLITASRNADVLVFDTMYTDDEFKQSKIAWGHSHPQYAMKIALKANAKRLILFHHDPNRTDEQMDEIVSNCRTYIKKIGANLEVMGAMEGMTIEF